MTAFENAIAAGLDACAVEPGASLLVGTSGGPDSTALLCALCALREARGLKLHACVVDHGIRPRMSVEGDIAFVRALCAERGVALEVGRVPDGRCRSRAREEGRSLEDVAREERHGLLAAFARRAGARWIALGHTLDDAVETVLMRAIQGSDAAGLAGIPLVRGPFIRPLLACSRAQVIDYLESLRQGWREDDTNADTSLLRNRVRRELVPVLDRGFPGWRTGLRALSAKAGLAAEALRDEAQRLGWKAAPRGFCVPREAFLRAPPAVRAASLMGLYDRVRRPGMPRRLPWRFIAPALAGTGLPRGRTILRGHGVRLWEKEGILHWERCIVSTCKKGYFIEVSDAGSSSVPEIGVRMDFVRASEKRDPEAGELALLSREIAPPLVLRSRRTGDQITLESGTKSLKELFTDWKVSEAHRQIVPVLADRTGVVAVLGRPLGYRDRIRAGARAAGGAGGERIVIRASRNGEEGREQQ